jgi:hypothetical protein
MVAASTPSDTYSREHHVVGQIPDRLGRVLLLTATIAPPPGAVLRHDSKIRFADYYAALRRYLELTAECFDGVVFVDNSGSSLRDLLGAIPPSNSIPVELISFQGNDHPVAYGKAYGEFGIIEYAMQRAQLLQSECVIWKSTGRLVCVNIPALACGSPKTVQWQCDLHNVPGVHRRGWSAPGAIDLRVFGFTRAGFALIVGDSRKKLCERFDAAHLYSRVAAHIRQGIVEPRFRVQPRFEGFSGRTGRAYHGTTQAFKDRVRSVARTVWPSLWL